MTKLKRYLIPDIKGLLFVTTFVGLAFWWLHGYMQYSMEWYSFVLPIISWITSLVIWNWVKRAKQNG